MIDRPGDTQRRDNVTIFLERVPGRGTGARSARDLERRGGLEGRKVTWLRGFKSRQLKAAEVEG
eukprot:864134-Rhodomonas_salina.1